MTMLTSVGRLFILTSLLGSGLMAETITLRGDIYPPYNSDPASDHPGIMVEIAKAVFGPKGHQVDYRLMPWPKTVEAVRAGTIDGAVAADMAGTPGLAYPTEPQGAWKPSFNVLRSSTWTFSGDASLLKITIGVVQDYDYGNDLTGKSYNAFLESNPEKVEVFKGNEANLLAVQALFAGKVEVIIEDPRVLQGIAKDNHLDPAQLKDGGTAGPGYPLFIGFAANERGQRLAKELTEGTSALRASGELAKILARYHCTDWK